MVRIVIERISGCVCSLCSFFLQAETRRDDFSSFQPATNVHSNFLAKQIPVNKVALPSSGPVNLKNTIHSSLKTPTESKPWVRSSRKMNLGIETDLRPVFSSFLPRNCQRQWGGRENLSRSRQCKTTRAIEGQKADNSSTRDAYLLLTSVFFLLRVDYEFLCKSVVFF